MRSGISAWRDWLGKRLARRIALWLIIVVSGAASVVAAITFAGVLWELGDRQREELQTDAMRLAQRVADHIGVFAQSTADLAANPMLGLAMHDALARDLYLRPLLGGYHVPLLDEADTRVTLCDLQHLSIASTVGRSARCPSELPESAAVLSTGEPRALVLPAVDHQPARLVLLAPVRSADHSRVEGYLASSVDIEALVRALAPAGAALRLTAPSAFVDSNPALGASTGRGLLRASHDVQIDLPGMRTRWALELIHPVVAPRGMWTVLGAAFLALLAGIGVAVSVARRIARELTGPLHDLASIARDSSVHRGLPRLARVTTEDEVGALAKAFNAMLTAQMRAREDLEAQVAERTRSLARALTQAEDSEARYHTLFSRSGVAMLLVDPRSFDIIDANAAAVAFYGYAPGAMRQQRLSALWPEVGTELSLAGAVSAHHRCADGRVRDVEIHASAVDIGGVSLRYLIVHDITERRRLEQARRVLTQAVEQSPVSIVIVNPDGRIEFVNPAFTRVSGYSAEEVLGKTPALLKSGATSDEEYAKLWQCISTGQSWQGTFRNRRKNGELYWESAHIAPVLDEDGHIVHYLGVKEDITARLDGERLQRDVSERIAKLVAQVPGVIFQYRLRADGSSTFPYASPAIQALLGLTPEDVAADGARIFGRVHPDDLESVIHSIRESAERLSAWSCRARMRASDGTERWVFAIATPEREANGATLWHGYLADVSDQHSMQSALLASEERLRLTYAAVRDGLWEWNLESGEVTWDDRCYEMLGYAPGSFRVDHDTLPGMVHPHDWPRLIEAMNTQIDHDESFSLEYRLRKRLGDWLWVEGRGKVVDRMGGRPVRIMGTLSDITERRAQTLLRQALLDNGATAILVVTPDRAIRYANGPAQAFFGLTEEDLARQDIPASRVHLDALNEDQFGTFYAMLRDKGRLRLEYPLRHHNGTERWCLMDGTLLDPEQRDGDVIWSIFDVSDRYQAEQALKTGEARLRALVSRFPGGLVVEDSNGRIALVNAVLPTIFPDLPPDLVGQSHTAIFAAISRHMTDRAAFLRQVAHLIADAQPVENIECALDDGRIVAQDFVPVVADGTTLGRLWFYRDITQRKAHELQLQVLATTDTLTGLPNRRSFMDRLAAELGRQHRQAHEACCVLMLDLDHFKQINDRWGHATGDEVLRQVGDAIQAVLRQTDFCGRLGGEEFGLLLPLTTLEGGVQFAERLRQRVGELTLPTPEGPRRVTCSIGLTALRADDAQGDQALSRADGALYEAKALGRDRVIVHARLD